MRALQNFCASPKVPLLLQTLQLKGRRYSNARSGVHCALWWLAVLKLLKRQCIAMHHLHSASCTVRKEIALEFINCSINAMPWNLFGPLADFFLTVFFVALYINTSFGGRDTSTQCLSRLNLAHIVISTLWSVSVNNQRTGSFLKSGTSLLLYQTRH